MTYHLGNNPPAAPSAPSAPPASRRPRSYGYWKISDPNILRQLREDGLPDVNLGRFLDQPHNRPGGAPVFMKVYDTGAPGAGFIVYLEFAQKFSNDPAPIRATDQTTTSGAQTDALRQFVEGPGSASLSQFSKAEVEAQLAPFLAGRASPASVTRTDSPTFGVSYNTRIALGIGAGALLLLVGLGVTLGGRKRAGMQPNRKRTSRSRGMRPNDRRWEMQQYYQSQHGAERRRASQRQAREDAALRMWRELTLPVIDSRGAVHMPSPDDRMAAIELVRQAYPDVDLWWLPRVEPNRSVFPNSRWKSSPGKHKYYNRTAIQDYFLRTATDAGKARLEIAESERENRPADLSHARLRSIDLSGAYLVAADLRGTDLSHADLSGANLSYANLEGANLRSADLTGAMLKEANLTRANLKDAELVNADLTNADLTDAYLYGADTTGAVMQPNRSAVYAIPERKAYPITTSMDAYHATQRLKQGRVKSEDEARRIVAAIKREHHDIWTKYLKDYPVSRIMTSKRKGLAARRRA